MIIYCIDDISIDELMIFNLTWEILHWFKNFERNGRQDYKKEYIK